jgi:ATP-dependent helicase Lhr and Lhr-like helicase
VKQKISSNLIQLIKNKGWSDLTDIQEIAFGPIYLGENCIIEAPTSGGKTEAVFFPLLSKIADQKADGIKIIYIAPLKALLNDIESRVTQYSNACSLSVFKWHGDVSQTEKTKQVLLPSDILLTTPESMEAILLRKATWANLFHNLQAVVIDEAHYFALSDRGAHLMALLERIDHQINITPQRIAMTATIGNPEELLQWVLGKKRRTGQSIIVKTKKHKEKDFKVHFFNSESNDHIQNTSLNDTLYRLLFNKKSIVFRNSRSGTEDSAKYINERNKVLNAGMPLKVRTHHSSVSKYLRESAEALIKIKREDGLNAIISTSTLELGIDIGELDQVIQIGELTSSGSFLQRVGRTGRREQKPQYFRGLCETDYELMLLSACINLGLQGISEKISFSKKSYHILAHQIICLCLQKMGTTSDKIWQILSNSYSFSGISKYKFEQLIKFMITEDYLRKADNEILLTSNKTETLFLKANWKKLFAIFDTGPMYNVVDGKKIIGTLDSDFTRMQEIPFLFVLGGIEWKAIKVNHDTQQISVVKNSEGNIPKWRVPKYSDIPFEIAQETGRILMNNEDLFFLDDAAKEGFEKLRDHYKKIQWDKTKWIIDILDKTKVLLWTFAGDKINRVISLSINSSNLGTAREEFQSIEISFSDKSSNNNIEQLISYIETLKYMRSADIEEMAKTKKKVVRFSKFSVCLPNNLSEEALFERSLDIEGCLRELRKVSLKIST